MLILPNIKVSKEELESIISTTQDEIKTQGPSPMCAFTLVHTQYLYSKFIRGDNTPEYAKYLGYVDAGELYPDFKPIAWKEYLQDLLAGKTEMPYPDGVAGINLDK